MHNKKNSVIIFFLVAVLLCGFLVHHISNIPVFNKTSAPVVLVQTTAKKSSIDKHGQQYLNYWRSPSQYDTDVDGALREDAHNNLIINREIRDVFDYFFTSAGERPLAEIIDNLHAYIDSTLSAQAAAQAKTILQQYLNYEQSLADHQKELKLNNKDESTIATFLSWRENLRKTVFGEALAAQFFADEQAYDDYTLERMHLTAASLADAEKQNVLNQLTAALPEKTQSMIKAQQRIDSALQGEERLATQKNTDTQEKQKYREEQYGGEVAARLQLLDEQRQAWNNKIEGYLIKKEQILNIEIDAASQQRMLHVLRNNLFTEVEQLRLPAFENNGS